MFVTCTKLCVCVIHLRILVSLFYTPGTEQQNKLHPYGDVKLNNFSVSNVFIFIQHFENPFRACVRACVSAADPARIRRRLGYFYSGF